MAKKRRRLRKKKTVWMGLVSLSSVSLMATAGSPPAKTNSKSENKTSTSSSSNSMDRSFSYDSSVTIAGVSPKDTRWLTVEIASEERKTKTSQRTYWPANTPLPPVYLNQGAGKYTINVYTSDGSLSTENKYKHLTSVEVENKDERTMNYLLPSLDIQSNNPELRELALKITDGITSGLAKSLAIHDWLISNIDYDQAGVDSNTYAGTPNDAYSVYKSKSGVCEGFANLAVALHRALGIRGRVAIGKLIGSSDDNKSKAEICSEPVSHAWAEVFVEDRWVSIDASLDAGHLDGDTMTYVKTPTERKYFDRAPELMKLTHLKCNDDGTDETVTAPAAATETQN